MKNFMKIRNIKKALFALLILAMTPAFAQQTNTLYFLDNVPLRHSFNPAFQPLSNMYLSLTPLGYTSLSLGLPVTLKDIYFKQNGGTGMFLNTHENKLNFYNNLASSPRILEGFETNILNFGFRVEKAYWTFSITAKQDALMALPKDFFKLALFGTPADIENNQFTNIYDLQQLNASANAYLEAALGYSYQMEKWSFGGKLKFLYGIANVSAKFDNLDLHTGIEEWRLSGNGALRVSSPAVLTVGDNFEDIKAESPTDLGSYLRPAGLGGAIDLGAAYSPFQELKLAAAITDLGFIRWNKNNQDISASVDYTFEGVNYSSEDGLVFDQLGDTLLAALKKSVKTGTSTGAYSSYISPKLNLSAEYGVLSNKLTVGLLSRTHFQNGRLYEELTAALNGRPADWFNASLSYSILNGRFSNLGAGISLRSGFLNWFFATDYIPLRYASLKVGESPNTVAIPVPYNTAGVNFSFGVSIVIGNNKDKDKDGVRDGKDKCPDTPPGVIVDKFGCPVDSDGDGVPDYLDKCPDTPAEAHGTTDNDGCPVDSDGDGVPDYLDKCPDSPDRARGFVDENGCPKDTDGDGVPDYWDRCPDTPQGLPVDSYGCVKDSDGDGVPDHLDKCPDTPNYAAKHVDEDGCIKDSDGDGVPDYLDKCPDTPAIAHGDVDENGCPIDSDGDGVPDYLDKCPDTPKEARAMVYENGCPKDTDGDGVPDYIDRCPTIAGLASNNGCPELKREIRSLFQKALQGIQFDTGKSSIKSSSFAILDQIAKVLDENPTYKVEIQGHTDNVGKEDANMKLSEERAASVRDYLIKKGVDEKRMTSKGFGPTVPVASNTTAAGKAKNRRVEFVVSFEEVHYEDVTAPSSNE